MHSGQHAGSNVCLLSQVRSEQTANVFVAFPWVYKSGGPIQLTSQMTVFTVSWEMSPCESLECGVVCVWGLSCGIDLFVCF